MPKLSFSTRFDEIDYAKMKIIAKHEKRTMANLVQYFCAKGIEEYEANNGEIILTEDDLYFE